MSCNSATILKHNNNVLFHCNTDVIVIERSIVNISLTAITNTTITTAIYNSTTSTITTTSTVSTNTTIAITTATSTTHN